MNAHTAKWWVEFNTGKQRWTWQLADKGGLSDGR
jgi:hypothetical protein